MVVTPPPDLTTLRVPTKISATKSLALQEGQSPKSVALISVGALSHAQKDALMVSPWGQVMSLAARLTALEQRLEPPKTPDNSSVLPSKGQKATRAEASRHRRLCGCPRHAIRVPKPVPG